MFTFSYVTGGFLIILLKWKSMAAHRKALKYGAQEESKVLP